MKDIDKVSDKLRRSVREVEDRIHWQTVRHGQELTDIVSIARDQTLARLLEDLIEEPTFSAAAASARAEVGRLAEAKLEPTQQEQVDALVPKVAGLFATFREARDASLTLGLRLRAAAAQLALSGKPRNRAAVASSGTAIRTRSPLKLRFAEFRDGVAAGIQRAVEPNGAVSRSAETLIGALASLIPSEEGQRPVYERSHVSDAFIAELAMAMKVAGRDYALLMGDHSRVFWRTGILPNIRHDLSVAGLNEDDFTADRIHQDLPRSRIFDAIDKAADDFEIRMRRGGVSAIVVAAPKPFTALDVLKSAVRYPMQYVALLTYLVLPILVVLGFAGDSAAAGILKWIIPFVLPVLVVAAFVQARAARQSAFDLAMEATRRQLRAEVSKTVRDIGDAITIGYSGFLTNLENKIEAEVLGKAEHVRRDAQTRLDAEVEMEMTALGNRIAALETLEAQLQTGMREAAKIVTDSIAALAKTHKPAKRRVSTLVEEGQA